MGHHSVPATACDARIPGASGPPGVIGLNRHARRALASRSRRQPVSGSPRPDLRVSAGPGGRPRRPVPGRQGRPGPAGPVADAGVGLDAAQPGFTALPAELTFGPAADISMGWDGTVWAIDAAGAPHLYNPVDNTWQPHGQGVDAAAIHRLILYVFRGDQVITVDMQRTSATAPQPIAAAFPSLPYSFTQRVTGAADINGVLTLFSGGRYMPADGSRPPARLADLPDWPQTPNWADGVIDGVFTGWNGIYLIRGDECVWTRDLTGMGGVGPVSDVMNAAPGTGLDAGAYGWLDGTPSSFYFQGPSLTVVPGVTYDPGARSYVGAIPGWPMTWNPVLRQAPSGRDGDLWSVLTADRASHIMQHDGDTWTQQNDQADSVSAGQDGTVMIASAGRLWQYAGGQQFNPLASLSGLVQVSVGAAGQVWGLDTANAVHRYDHVANAFSPATDVGQAVDLSASADGTLWHAKPGDSNMHRFLSGVNVLQPGIAVQQGTVASVQKVAATGFGAAYCLARDTTGATSAYRYDSPYVFMSPSSYHNGGYPGFRDWAQGTVATGLGKVFFTNVEVGEGFATTTNIVSLDAHTGQELSRSAPLTALPGATATHGAPVLDEANGLIYVGTLVNGGFGDADTAINGELLALDAHDLTRVVWSFQTLSSIQAPPAIMGNTLIISDRLGSFYAFDIRATLSDPAHPAPARTWSAQLPAPGAVLCTAPVRLNNCFYAAAWVPLSPHNSVVYLVELDSSASTVAHWELHTYGSDNDSDPGYSAPVAVSLPAPGPGVPPAGNLYVNAGNAVVLVKPDHSILKFDLPASRSITTGLAWDAGAKTIWFGDDYGALYGLDADLNGVAGTPVGLAGGTSVTTTPVICTRANGDTMVLAGVVSNVDLEGIQAGTLYGFDPETRTLGTVPTGLTQITALSAVTNGVVYAAGLNYGAELIRLPVPVFGIRVDGLVQEQQYLIIESQLMQDPDETAPGHWSTDPAAPVPSVARYQTHLTVVDDQKNAQPWQAVKIWADAPGTVITIDGKQFTVGPGDAQFATATTGADGSLVVVSDAAGVNAPALRVWAAFMDPYERIVVYPDQEWHGRVTSSYSDPAAAAAAPDPVRPNLSTVSTYQGTPLFTAGEKSQNVPQSVAGAIAQMNKGLALGGGKPATLAGTLAILPASDPAAAYVAYPDLPGMQYAPSNARAQRPATISQPFGLHLTAAGDGTHQYTPLAPSDARAAVDALTGAAWTPGGTESGPAAGRAQSLGNIFTDFWNWLAGAVTKAVTKITQIVVSVAEDVVVGIQMLVNGVETVFKAIVRTVEDVVHTVATFFLQLEKLIEDVIQALSVLFDFDEIKKTHTWLKGQVTGQVQTLKTALAQHGKPAVDHFFTLGEEAIAHFFSQVKATFDPQQSINQMHGMGTTVHTAMTAGPGRAGAGSSQAVQGSWGIQKMKSGLLASGSAPGSASWVSASAEPAGPLAAENPIADFANAFVASLADNPTLKQSSAQLENDFCRLVTPTSAAQFFTTLVDTLLGILQELLVGALAVGQAFVDGFFAVIDDVIDGVMTALEEPVPIPVIGWLYERLFGEQLTMLNAITLVTAIPVTLLFRVITGQYPSQVLTEPQPVPGGAGVPTGRRLAAQGLSEGEKEFLGLAVAVGSLCYGVFNGMSDAEAADEYTDLDEISKAAVFTGFLLTLLSNPTATGDTPSPSDWAVFAISAIIALTAACGLPVFGLKKMGTQVLSLIICMLCTILCSCSIIAYVNDGDRSTNANLGFSANLIGAFPGIVNPVRFMLAATLGLGPVIVGAVDVVSGLALCALGLATTFDNQS